MASEIKINIVRPPVGPVRSSIIPGPPRYTQFYSIDPAILSIFEQDITDILRMSLYEDNQLRKNTNRRLNISGHRYSENKYTETTCSICMEPYKKNQIVCKCECDHVFHKGCLDKWVQYKASCPLCRESVPTKEK